MKSFDGFFTGVFHGDIRNTRNDLTRIGIERITRNCERFLHRTPWLPDIMIRFQAEEPASSPTPLHAEYLIMTHRGREHVGKRVHHEDL